MEHDALGLRTSRRIRASDQRRCALEILEAKPSTKLDARTRNAKRQQQHNTKGAPTSKQILVATEDGSGELGGAIV